MAKKETNNISIYQWDYPSSLNRVDVRSQEKKPVIAYLYAPEGDDVQVAKLHELREVLGAKGWTVSPDIRNDHSVLRVNGAASKDELLHLLEEKQFTQGAPKTTAPAPVKPKSFVERVKAHALQASGIIYTIGNSLYVVSGIKRKNDIGQIGTGVFFASGDVAVALFGGKDDARQFKSLMTHLAKDLKKHGVAIPKDSAFAAEISTRGESFGEKTYDFIHEHINKIKAIAEVLGGVAYFKAGHDQGRIEKQITAVIFSLGFGSSIFIKEKKPDQEKLKHAGPLAKAWAFVQESPLRVAGWSGLSNTILTTKGAYTERKEELLLAPEKRINAYQWDFATAGTMLVANNLYALSHKSAGGKITNGGLLDDIYGITAQVLSKVPEEKREAAIKTAANFLGDRVDIPDTHKQAEAKLRRHIKHATQVNPWFKAASEAYHIPPEAAAEVSQKLQPAPQTDTHWADHVNKTEQSALSAAL